MFLCDLMDCSLLGSSVHGILQARILEWVAIPSPGDLPNPGMETRSPALQANSLLSEPRREPHLSVKHYSILNILKQVYSIILQFTLEKNIKKDHKRPLLYVMITEVRLKPGMIQNHRDYFAFPEYVQIEYIHPYTHAHLRISYTLIFWQQT